MDDIRLPYKTGNLKLIGAMGLFGACAALIGREAATNDRGLILNHLLEFSAQGATLFYWALAGAALLFVLLAALALVKNNLSKRELVLTGTYLEAPKNGISNRLVRVQYSAITDLVLQQVQGIQLLKISHTQGKLTLASSMLPGKEAFAQVLAAIEARVATQGGEAKV
ncbi:hypothetical protein [Gallaecimonas xiamenensis]|uniref:DUF304 domain-containing protein n=1 Tax=Gallaecimonas xiamenensis 3-C-1 TaxID=745411 RepID=K2IYX7_9GAMM|nr:hypothetical protein [Gallaecimonas xiamenensis]EKE68103.1 hypothetical protein B3C1_17442 [Gallaecimonas xiamenensis 3-C-1]